MRTNPYVEAVYERSTLASGPRAVLAALANHCDADGYAFPAVGRIAQLCAVSERSVRRAFAAAEALGEIERTVGGGRGITSLYRITLRPVDNLLNPDTGDRVTNAKPGQRRHETRTPVTKNPDNGDRIEKVQESTKKPRHESPHVVWNPDAMANVRAMSGYRKSTGTAP